MLILCFCSFLYISYTNRPDVGSLDSKGSGLKSKWLAPNEGNIGEFESKLQLQLGPSLRLFGNEVGPVQAEFGPEMPSKLLRIVLLDGGIAAAGNMGLTPTEGPEKLICKINFYLKLIL